MNIARQLSANLTVTATWTQCSEEGSDAVYTAPSNGRSTINGARINNFSGADAAAVVFAVAATTPSNTAYQDHLSVPATVGAGNTSFIPDIVVIPAGQALWAKATGTTPLVGVRVPILETT